MKYTFICLLHIIYLMFIAINAYGLTYDENGIADNIQYKLIKNSFENVVVVQDGNRVIVTYENRIYRDEIRALKKVLEIISPLAREGMNVALIPQNRGVPIVVINVPANEKLASVIDVDLDVYPIWRKIKNVQRANSSFCKFDIIVHPQFIALLGHYDDPIKSQINIAPEINTTLWKGMSLSAQLIIPLQNELYEEGDHWRPGLFTINQILRLPYNNFISATVGSFSQNRYGVDLEAKKYFANGTWSIGTNIGYTGYGHYLKGAWYYTKLNSLTFDFNVAYRFSRYDLTLGATYGKFLYKDRGWRFDIFRQFGEINIGFFAIKTEKGINGGFNFSIPIFPSKYLPAKRIRISPAKEFSWGYYYKALPNSGIQVETGQSISSFMKRLNSDYIKNQITEH